MCTRPHTYLLALLACSDREGLEQARLGQERGLHDQLSWPWFAILQSSKRHLAWLCSLFCRMVTTTRARCLREQKGVSKCHCCRVRLCCATLEVTRSFVSRVGIMPAGALGLL